MISIKPKVSIIGIKPEIVVGLMIANSVLEKHNLDCVLTSGIDGKHGEKSLHYSGLAIDLRRSILPPSQVPIIVTELKNALQTEFDVVLEVDHIHIEFDPKG